jgi:hypothetical protein
MNAVDSFASSRFIKEQFWSVEKAIHNSAKKVVHSNTFVS